VSDDSNIISVTEDIETISIIETALEVATISEVEDIESTIEVVEYLAPSVGNTQSVMVTRAAATVLPGHRAVAADSLGRWKLAQPGSANGVTVGASAEGEPNTAVLYGLMIEPSFSWAPDLPIYCGVDGALTQECPLSGTLQIIGYPAGPQGLLVAIRQPIILI
jgi:hypothetical protein